MTLVTITITITITQREIDEGVPYSSTRCPVAKAARNVVRRGASVSIGTTVFDLCYRGELWVFDLPKRVGEWVDRFDAGNPVRPMTFKMRLPKEVIR